MILNFLKGFLIDGKRKQTNFEEKIKKGVKIHTIRIDSKDRWKKGMKIHFSTGSRTNNYNCFKEGECTGTQTIEIIDRTLYIDDILIENIEELIENDGFDCISDFWSWFDQYTPFTGKIIHWTNLKY